MVDSSDPQDETARWQIKPGTDLAAHYDMCNSCVIRVLGFFQGDANKTLKWFATANPMLGGMQPNMLIRVGCVKKLYDFITTALAENAPPKRACSSCRGRGKVKCDVAVGACDTESRLFTCEACNGTGVA